MSNTQGRNALSLISLCYSRVAALADACFLCPTQLPPKFGRLTNLTSLTMDQCRSIRTAPDAIGSLTNLRELHYDCGKLPLPVSFSQLVRLETVTLSGVAAQQV
jgi:hypothetical protein